MGENTKIVTFGNPFVDATLSVEAARKILKEIDPYEYFGVTKGKSEDSPLVSKFLYEAQTSIKARDLGFSFNVYPGCTSANVAYLIAALNSLEVELGQQQKFDISYIAPTAPGGSGLLQQVFLYGTNNDGIVDAGVNPLLIHKKDQIFSSALVLIDADGERTFVKTPAIQMEPKDLDEQIRSISDQEFYFPRKVIAESDIFVINGYELMGKYETAISAIEIANKASSFVVLDTANFSDFQQTIRESCDNVSYDMLVVTGEVSQSTRDFFFERELSYFISTLGGKGSIIYTKNNDVIYVQGHAPFEGFINTNGAGDALVGKLLHSFANFISTGGTMEELILRPELLEKMANRASYLAGQACGEEGARIPLHKIPDIYMRLQHLDI
ncbi:carbohydrate kinase family protein [Candidatus Woesearchaeota archaeon]|nr:carbohydrate kinase family protein [Candidatus Woesearchaeota archaeon]